MTAALWGVVLGGLLTIAGQTVAELLKARAQEQEREAGRQADARSFHREALELATAAATELKAVLVEYEGVGAPTPQLELRFRQSTSEFERLVPRVTSARVRGLLNTWKEAATSWSNGDATQETEGRAWKAAVDACGEAVRSYL
jgi:hypothetical protein